MKCELCESELQNSGHYAIPTFKPNSEFWNDEKTKLGDIFRCCNPECKDCNKNIYRSNEGEVFNKMKG